MPTPEIHPLSLHDALPISRRAPASLHPCTLFRGQRFALTISALPSSVCVSPSSGLGRARSEEHTSELQSLRHLVCRLLLEKKKKKISSNILIYISQLQQNK